MPSYLHAQATLTAKRWCCNTGDYTGDFPCTSNEFNGQTIEVYDQFDLKGNNDEVVW